MSTLTRAALGPLAAMIGICGCGDSTGPTPPGTEPLQTDSEAYVARFIRDRGAVSEYGFTVVARFLNSGTDTVFLDRCGLNYRYPIYAVILADSMNRAAAYDNAWMCGGISPFAVAPHATRTDTLRLVGPNNTPYGPLEGVFRVRYYVRYCGDATYCGVSPTDGRSNAFRVTIE